MSGVHPLIQSILESHGAPAARPDEPPHGEVIWYRGWECSYCHSAAGWTPYVWTAAKGGWDLDCQQTSARTWTDLLDAIDDEEETA